MNAQYEGVMGRYPRTVRRAKFKCVSCNAPGALTVDDELHCVECGDRLIRQRPPARIDGDPGNGDVARNSEGTEDGREASREENGSAIHRVETFDVEGTDTPDSAGESVLLSEDSPTRPDVSVVMPTRNEEAAIAECIDRARQAVERLGMTAEIIVSDSSTDDTPALAESNGAIVVHPSELGYGAAYRHGFSHARGEYIVMGDADMTYDFTELPRLMEPILADEADFVMGSRLRGEIRPGAMPPLHKYIGNPLLTSLLNRFYNSDVSDAHSGFRVLTREALETLDVGSQGMEFASEMVMDASAKGLRIREIPITYHPRVGDAKLESFSDGWRHVKFMLMNCPTYLFTLPGLVIGGVGVVAMILALFDLQLMTVTVGVPGMIVGSLLAVLGYQLLLLGFATSIGGDPIRRTPVGLTRLVEEHVTVERGIAGVAVLVVAVGGFGITFHRPVLVGTASTSDLQVLLLLGTILVISIETMFYAFHVSALGNQRG